MPNAQNGDQEKVGVFSQSESNSLGSCFSMLYWLSLARRQNNVRFFNHAE